MSEFRRRLMMTKSGGGGGNDDYKVIFPTLIPNTYITTSGAEVSYNGWSSTDFIDLDGYNYLIDNSSAYCSFYDANKSPISRPSLSNYKVAIPSNARYYRTSASTGNMGNTQILLTKPDIQPTMLTNIEYPNSYITHGGDIASYSGWNVFRYDFTGVEQGIWGREHNNCASYHADNSPYVLDDNYFDSTASFVRFSYNTTSYLTYIIPK